MLRDQLGSFDIPFLQLELEIENEIKTSIIGPWRRFLNECLIVRAYYSDFGRHIKYVAHHPKFEIIPAGIDAPKYYLKFNETSDRIEFSKELC